MYLPTLPIKPLWYMDLVAQCGVDLVSCRQYHPDAEEEASGEEGHTVDFSAHPVSALIGTCEPCNAPLQTRTESTGAYSDPLSCNPLSCNPLSSYRLSFIPSRWADENVALLPYILCATLYAPCLCVFVPSCFRIVSVLGLIRVGATDEPME